MIKLQMFFKVSEGRARILSACIQVYVAALRKQKLSWFGAIEVFPDVSKEIGRSYRYKYRGTFETEDLRRRWTRTPEHDEAWNTAIALSTSYEWIGYDVAGLDQAVPYQTQFGIADAEARIKSVQSSEPVKRVWNSGLGILYHPMQLLIVLQRFPVS